METLWVFIVVVGGAVYPPADAPSGIQLVEVTNISNMYFDSLESCTVAREKFINNRDEFMSSMAGLKNLELKVGKCNATEFSVEE